MLALSACAGTYKLEHSAVLNKPDFKAYKTFSILPYDKAARIKQAGRAFLSEMDYNNLANGVRNELIARGYAESAGSDMEISFALFMERNADITTNLYPDYYYGRFAPYYLYRRPYTGYTTARIYKEGIWVVDIVDVQRKQHVFSAAVSAEMGPKKPALKDAQEIQKASDLLFKKFPVKVKK
jgi:hypothetical protein